MAAGRVDCAAVRGAERPSSRHERGHELTKGGNGRHAGIGLRRPRAYPVTLRVIRSLLLLVVSAGISRADAIHESSAPTDPVSRHLAYVELGGKAGAYGIGYERAITSRLALGGVASFLVLRGQQLSTIAPYLHATLLRRGKHALFGELGAVLVHSRIPSPVEDWDGMADTGGGGVAALGWERAARHVVLRAQASVVVGEGGAAPWAGFAIGFRP